MASVALEKAILSFQEVIPLAQIFLILAGCRDCISPQKTDMQLNIASHYRIPVVDYAHLVREYNYDAEGRARLWPQEAHVAGEKFCWRGFYPAPNELLPSCVNFPDLHPPWMVHQYYSDHVASAFVDSLESTCARGSYRYESKATESLAESQSGHTFWGPDVLKAFPVCLRPLTYFSSESYFNQKGLSRSQLTGLQKPNITRGSWMLFEDRKGKPGWISNVSRSSMEIPFNLSSGHKASLTI